MWTKLSKLAIIYHNGSNVERFCERLTAFWQSQCFVCCLYKESLLDIQSGLELQPVISTESIVTMDWNSNLSFRPKVGASATTAVEKSPGRGMMSGYDYVETYITKQSK